MLQDTMKSPNNRDEIVSWVDDRTAFQVHRPADFVQKIAPYYFDQTKYESFRRQLIYWGFKRGRKRCYYYHNCFVRDNPEALTKIVRLTKKKSTAKKDDLEDVKNFEELSSGPNFSQSTTSNVEEI